MTVFRFALAKHGREVKFFRHGEAEPYHTSRALVGPIGSGSALGERDARGAVSPSRRVLWFKAGEVFPRPTDGYIEVDGVRLLVERADSPTVPTACRAVAREMDAERCFAAHAGGGYVAGVSGSDGVSAVDAGGEAVGVGGAVLPEEVSV